MTRRAGFVNAWFEDLVGRKPSPAELEGWSEALRLQAPPAVAGALARQLEVQVRVLRELAAPLQLPLDAKSEQLIIDSAGTRYCVRRDLRMFLAESPALGATVEERIGRAHQLVLGRPATFAERRGWALLCTTGGFPINRVAYQLMRSDEFQAHAVRSLVQRYLGRPPAAEELAFMRQRLEAGVWEEDLIASLVSGPEYAHKRKIPAK